MHIEVHLPCVMPYYVLAFLLLDLDLDPTDTDLKTSESAYIFDRHFWLVVIFEYKTFAQFHIVHEREIWVCIESMNPSTIFACKGCKSMFVVFAVGMPTHHQKHWLYMSVEDWVAGL